MRIDSFQSSQVTGDSEQVKRQQQPSDAARSSSTLAPDSARISSQNLQQRATASPDIRQDRVNAVKQAMEAGTHNVSNSQLASALFNEFFKR